MTHAQKSKKRIAVWLVLSAVGCLVAWAFNFAGTDSGGRHNGKALTVWEQDAFAAMANGSYVQLIRPEVQKMGPETIPFWLERLQAPDSLPTRCYSRLWQILP